MFFTRNGVDEEEIEWYYRLWQCLPHADKTSDSFPHDEYHLFLLISAAFKGVKLKEAFICVLLTDACLPARVE